MNHMFYNLKYLLTPKNRYPLIQRQPFTLCLSHYLSVRKWCVEIPTEPRASFLWGSYCFCQRTWQRPPLGWPWFPVWLHRVICRLTLPYSLTVLQICFQYVTTWYGANPGDRSPSTVAFLSNSAPFLVMFWTHCKSDKHFSHPLATTSETELAPGGRLQSHCWRLHLTQVTPMEDT